MACLNYAALEGWPVIFQKLDEKHFIWFDTWQYATFDKKLKFVKLDVIF